MSIEQLLSELPENGIHLWLEEGKLKFRAPASGLPDHYRSKILEHRDAIVALLKQSRGADEDAPRPLGRDEPLPLSFEQERLWFLHQLFDELALFNMIHAFEWQGTVDEAALESAIRQVIERHEILRTRIEVIEGVPFQVPADALRWKLAVEDHTGIDPSRYQAVCQQVYDQELSTVFDLAGGEVIRTRLLRFDGRAVLFFSLDHIASDAWSQQILLSELSQFYLAAVESRPCTLPPLAVQYADYAAWQRKRLASGKLQASIDFWRGKLDDAAFQTRLPPDRPRPRKKTFRGRTVSYALRPELHHGLKALCARHGLTPSNVMLSAYALLVARYTRRDSVSFGIPTAGRERTEIQALIGFFVNAIVCRIDIPESGSALAYVQSVQQSLLQALEHQQVPIECLAEIMNQGRGSSEHLDMPMAFNFVDESSEQGGRGQALGNLPVTPMPLGSAEVAAKHEVTLYLTASATGIGGWVEYNADLFSSESMERFVEHYDLLLARLIQGWDRDLRTVSWYDDADILRWLKAEHPQATRAFPLSPVQRDIYFSALLNPSTRRNNLGCSSPIYQPIDLVRWESAITRLVAGDDMLRMRLYRFKDSKIHDVYQWVTTDTAVDYEFHDWSDGQARAPGALDELIDEFTHRPFDLEKGPLHRLALIRLASDHYVVVLAAHHVLFDGGAVLLLGKRIAEAYLNPADAERPRRGTEEFQAYVAAMTASMDKRETIDFWRAKLAGVEALPVPQPDAGSVLVTKTLQFDRDLWAGVKQYCRAQGITPAIYCKGIYGLLIDYYFQGQADFLISEFTLGRTEAQLEDLGCYYRQQPFVFARDILQGERTLAEFWGYHKNFQRACKPYTALSAHAQAQLAPAQGVSFMYNFNGYIKPIDILYGSGPDDQKGFIPQIEDAVQFYMKNVAQDMQVNLVYPEGTFADDRLLERFISVTRQLCVGDCPSLAMLDFLLPDETCRLAEWEARRAAPAIRSGTGERAPDVLSLFARQCQANGSGIALRDADGSMTYAELDAQSSALARRLKERYLKPGDKLALLLPRDRRFAIAMLAAAKASACYVPLDPEHPSKRIDYILEDAAVAVVITCEDKRGLVDPQRYPLLLWEELPDLQGQAPAGAAGRAMAPSDPDRDLYVIYTSGTTGNPKGVLVSAGNVASLFEGCSGLFEFGAADRWSVCHSFAFDFSVWELWGPLITGGCACIVDAATIKDSPRFHAWLEESAISVLSQTPSAFLSLDLADRQLAANRPQASLQALRYVVFGGEALDINQLHGWRERHALGRPALINMYGITEITVHATFHEVTEEDFAAGRNTIGKALPHLVTVVLDACLRRVPPGFPGELFIAGSGVAQGYLRREALTAERFLSMPALGYGAATFYRTGDRARYLEDGNLQYLGRNDRQVKIRGYRIELDEIENVMRSCAGVSAAAVKVVEFAEPVGKRVVAYVCGVTSTADLGLLLQERLPHYMVPSNIVAMAQLPLTDNGKINYRALPRPDLFAEPEEAAELATPTQMRLAEIIGDLLQQRVLSRTSDFFALGGHSLLATQLVSRIEQQFGIEIPLRMVFEHARLDELADEIDRRLKQAAAPAESVIVPCPRDIPLPLSFAQQRLWFLNQVAPQDPFYNLPVVVQFERLNAAALEKTLLHIIARHEVFRTNFVPDEQGRPRVIVKNVPSNWRLEILDLSGLSEQERRQRVEAETRSNASTPFALERDLLLRCKLLDLGDRHVLLLATHHIVADGWSLEVLKREMALLYDAFGADRPSPLPPLPIQYTDFAYWQRQWLSGGRLQTHLDYWRRQFDGVEQLDFPLDRVRPAQLNYRGDYVPMALTPELSARLRALAQDQEATLFMVSLAALYVLLARYTGQQDVCIGTPIANRNHAAIEALVGFFVNTLALRVQVDQASTFEHFLQVVKRTALGAYEHQDMPFELLVDHLNIERDASRNPLFQIMFVLQNVPKNVAANDADGPAGELLESGRKSSIFDMRVELFDNSEVLTGGIEFNVDLFDRSTIEAIAAAYRHLLGQIVADPGRGVMDYSLVDEVSARQQIEGFNSTAAVLDDAACLHHLVERQCRATPEKIALRFENHAMTYRQLDAAADQVACRLQALGVGGGELVGVAMERSLEMAVGLLGILKAGAAYVPLDPEYPANRCRYMVEDTAVKVVLVQPRYRDWPVLAGIDHVLVMADGHLLEAGDEPAAQPCGSAGADSPCYVIYTSGSTGRPKGVVNIHRALVNRIAWMQARYRLTADDVVLQKTPYSFDVSVWEFFWTLAYGATLVIARPQGHRDPQYLAALIAREAVTTLHFVPSMLQTFLRLADMPSCASLRRIICSGEALGKVLEQQCKAQLPHAQLHNLYGPTEAAIDVSHWTCDGIDDRRPLPIGHPISNCQLFVLDARGELLPRGAVGELHIGGVGLARGYLNLPDMSAEKFIDSRRLGMRLYKTGDKARHRFDGALEYYGRIDHQVKIRGLRIEQGEIEAVLMRAGGLSSAAVTVWENKAAEPQAPDAGDDKLLVAYVVPSNEALEPALQADSASLSAGKVDQWGHVFDGIYSASEGDTRPEFDIVGWNSSYTGQPIDPREMEDWVRNTVERIGAVSGPRVLEVGCGTGLLLFRLAKGAQRYVACDISARALAGIRAHVGQDERFAHVLTLQAAADECAVLLDEPFDTIVMNSVIQYFPSADYAEKVLTSLVEKIPAQGGSLFIGDVRHVGLMRAFHGSVVCFDAPPHQTVLSLRRDINERIGEESELLLDPAFFHDFCRRHRREIRCAILLKREDNDNEMANFRYDVVLRVAAQGEPMGEASEADLCHRVWPRDLCSIADLDGLAADRAYVISGIPNTRVQGHIELAEKIFAADTDDHQKLGELRAGVPHAGGPALGEFWQWAERRGWRLEMAPDSNDLRYVDLLLVGPRFARFHSPSLAAWQCAAAGHGKGEVVYANQPMRETMERLLVKRLRDYAENELPAYMVPQQFIVLDRLPLTASGKLDRKALPAPKTANQLARNLGRHVAPETPFERQVAQLWCDLLKLDKVSMTADFFALGGHSLLAVELIAQVKKLTGRHLPLISIFNHRTLEAFCRCVEEPEAAPQAAAAQFGVAVPLSSRHHPDKLFCIHPGTGDAFSYRALAAHMEPHASLWGIQVPGFEAATDDPISVQHAPLALEDHRSFPLLAAHYCEVMKKVQPTGPYRVLGWSSGGLLALEIARQLQERGETVSFIGMVDSQVPDAGRHDYGLDGLAYLPDGSPEAVRAHPLHSLLEAFGLTEVSSAAQLNHVIRITKYLRKLEGAHSPVMPAGQVHLFVAEDDPAAIENPGHLHAGWQGLGAQDLRVHSVPGTHFTVLHRDHAAAFADLLSSLLEQAGASDSCEAPVRAGTRYRA
ncbi:MAG TPA: amino acid adenylation domain-containing protein [Paucimonas sp.]|nr:amino acid adenylation domain-containing protein [Paucimonas sp.]